MGKMHPSIRIVYFLFTKIDRANKKMRLSTLFIKWLWGGAVDKHRKNKSRHAF